MVLPLWRYQARRALMWVLYRRSPCSRAPDRPPGRQVGPGWLWGPSRSGEAMSYRVTLIEGDGIGPEVTGATTEILRAAGAPLEWERVPAGMGAYEKYGNPLPDGVLKSLRANRVGLKGPL